MQTLGAKDDSDKGGSNIDALTACVQIWLKSCIMLCAIFVQYNVNTGLGDVGGTVPNFKHLMEQKSPFAERSCHLPSVLESLLRLPRSGQLRGRPGGGRRQEVPLRQRLAQQKKARITMVMLQSRESAIVQESDL